MNLATMAGEGISMISPFFMPAISIGAGFTSWGRDD